MYKTFENLNEEKQQKIINSSIEEFANKGYKNATIDNIVSKAGISKGSIFQYFKNKKNLFIYICDYLYNIMINELIKQNNKNETDFFEIYRNVALIKFNMLRKSPFIFSFFKMVYSDTSEVTQNWLEKKLKDKQEFTFDFIGEYDKTKFKENIDVDTAVKVVNLTFDGLSMKWIEKLSKENYEEDLKALFNEVEEYINFYKKLYYKGE